MPWPTVAIGTHQAVAYRSPITSTRTPGSESPATSTEKPMRTRQKILRGCDHLYMFPTNCSQKMAGATNEMTTAVVPPNSPKRASMLGKRTAVRRAPPTRALVISVCLSSAGAVSELASSVSACCRVRINLARIDWMCMRQRKIIIGKVKAKAITMASRAAFTANELGSESRTLALTAPPKRRHPARATRRCNSRVRPIVTFTTAPMCS
mmetsp:Transcript_45407/g.119243  ORF Transcript_45407/g.119243 Transcript_45407/m.119243 type:complete len:209 (-) Transcript_45407:1110-1736(-)